MADGLESLGWGLRNQQMGSLESLCFGGGALETLCLLPFPLASIRARRGGRRNGETREEQDGHPRLLGREIHTSAKKSDGPLTMIFVPPQPTLEMPHKPIFSMYTGDRPALQPLSCILA